MRYVVRAVLVIACLVLGPWPALAADPFPSRPITLIVPWQAGGIPDLQLRLLGGIAGQPIGHPIVNE